MLHRCILPVITVKPDHTQKRQLAQNGGSEAEFKIRKLYFQVRTELYTHYLMRRVLGPAA